jgi:hypothetical protein
MLVANAAVDRLVAETAIDSFVIPLSWFKYRKANVSCRKKFVTILDR